MESTSSESVSKQQKEDNDIVEGCIDINNIPLDIILNILSRVPVKSLLRFKCSCKSWYYLLTHDTSFIQMHINQSINARRYNLLVSAIGIASVDCFPLQFDNSLRRLNATQIGDYPLGSQGFFPTLFSGSCNGIYLIAGHIQGHTYATNVAYLWNPSTKDHMVLPSTLAQLPRYPNKYNCAYGLGYDSIKNDYKVIRVLQHYDNCNQESIIESVVHVYSLQTNSCRKNQGIPEFITDELHNNLSDTGLFLKGAIHWWFRAQDFYRMLAFDVSTEEYKEVPLPNNMRTDESNKFMFGALENFLCLYQYLVKDYHVDLFMMQVYGVKESWTKFFRVNLAVEISYFRPLWLNDIQMHILLKHSSEDGLICTPILHFQNTRCNKYVTIWGDSIHAVVTIEPWIESLVSLKQDTIVQTE